MGQALPFSEHSVGAEVADPVADDGIARLCHDLRTPLTSAMGFLQLALRDTHPDSDAARRNLEMVDQQLRRLAGLINDLAVRAASPEH